MDLRSGYPLWPVLDGLLGTWPALTSDLTCEVAILGGGVSGALIADRLSAAGVECLVIDQREIGWGSTAASTALLQYDLDRPLRQLIQVRGETDAVACYHACVEAIDALDEVITSLDEDCGYSRQRVVYLASRASDVKGLQREYDLRKQHALPVDYWNRAELRRQTGIDRAAALSSTQAAQVDPYRLTTALLRRSATRGVKVFDRTAVRRTRHLPNGGLELHTDRGATISCRTLVRATGYETEQLLQQRAVTLHSTYAFASEPIADLPEHFPQLWESARPYLYIRTTPDHRLIVGGEDDDFANADRRDRALPARVKTLTRKVKRLLPQFTLEPAFYWAGTFAESSDSLPYIGAHPDYPDTLFALCYGGNGTTFAMLAAGIIADMVLGRPSPRAPLFAFDR